MELKSKWAFFSEFDKRASPDTCFVVQVLIPDIDLEILGFLLMFGAYVSG